MNKGIPLLLLFVGCQQPVEYLETRLPEMEMSSTSIDFGTIQWGTSSTKSLYIENQGDLPMGFTTSQLKQKDLKQISLSPTIPTISNAQKRDLQTISMRRSNTILVHKIPFSILVVVFLRT